MAELKAGIYKTGKGNTLVMAEDNRNLYALYDESNAKAPFGKREKWPVRYSNYQEFAKSQNMTRVSDFKGVFF